MSYGMEYTGSSPQRRTKAEYYQFQSQSLGPSSSSLCLALPRGSQGIEPSLRSKRSNAMQTWESRPILRTADSLDFAQQVYSGGLQVTNRNEKELLQELNDRFAGFTEKVRLLESQNITLEREIEELREKKTSLSQVYDPEIKDLRELVHELTIQKRTIEVEHQHLEQDLYMLRDKCEAEAHQRSDAEGCIMTLKRDINDANLSKLELDRKAQSLLEEIIFLKKNHQEEVSEMLAQLQEAQVATVEMKDLGKADITAALRDIRKQLEGHTSSNVQQTEEFFRAKVAKLTEAAEINKEALQATKQEIQEHRRQLQSKSIELGTVKSTKEALESQLNDLEERHDIEVNQYQNAIGQLECELTHTKCEMSGHLREYQDLLNVKMALDVEIASYRKLLEGEETRLSSVSGDHISVPYVYRQSPIYSLPRSPKHRSTSTKAEPQYKFVEEIITETTREVEMTEIEETESELTCVEKPTAAQEESAEEGDTVQITVRPEVAAEEDAQTAEEEQEETAPDKADTEKRSAPLEEVSEDVKEQDTKGKVFPEEETRDTEPLDRSPGEQEKAECAKADMDEETENTPDGVETVKTLEEGSAKEKEEECTDTVKAEETKESKELKVGRSLQVSDSESASESHENEGRKETTEVTAGKAPQQRDSEITPERSVKEVSKLGVPPEAKPQEKKAEELERSPEDSPVKEEDDKVPKVQSIAAQGDEPEGKTSPKKMTLNLTELKVAQQPQDTDSPAKSEVKVSGPPENGGVKAKQIKEAADPGKSQDDSSLETAKDEQKTPLNSRAVDIVEPFKKKVASPSKDEKDSGTPSTVESFKPAGYLKPEPTDRPEAETPSVLKPKESHGAIVEEAEKKASAPVAVTEDKKADKVTAAEKSTKEPEESQKAEATPLPKEESKSVNIEKVDMEKSADEDERKKEVEPAEEKSAPAKDLPDEPTSQDASAVVAKPGLKTVETKVMKAEGLDSREAKDTEKTADTSEGDHVVKGVEATIDLPETEREEKAVPTSDTKDKEDSAKKIKEDADPKIEENGFYESESIAREPTSPKEEEVKVPVIQSQVEPKEKKAELKAPQLEK